MTFDTDVFGPKESVDGSAFTFRDLVSILFKHCWVILGCFVLVSVLVAVGIWSLPPTYIAEGKVLVKTEQQGTPSIFSGVAAYREPLEADPVNRKLETEMEMIATRDLSERVVRKLNLTYPEVYHDPLTHLLRPVDDLVDWAKVHIFNYPPDPDAYGFKGTVKEFNASFTVEPLKSKSAETTSNVIQVTLKATDPKIAQMALQALLEEYVGQTVEQNAKMAHDAYELVQQNLQQAAEQLQARREQQRKFIADKGETLPSLYASVLPMSSDQVRDSTTGTATNGAQTTIGVLRNRLVQLQLKLIDMRETYTDDSESIKLLKQSIALVEERIRTELQATAKSEETLSALDLEVKASEQQYLDLRHKLEQIALFLSLNPAESYNRLISEPPLVPKSSEWKRSVLVTILGSLGGLLLGLGIAGYREYSDHRLSSADAIRTHLGLNPLAVVDLLGEADLRAAFKPAGLETKGRAG